MGFFFQAEMKTMVLLMMYFFLSSLPESDPESVSCEEVMLLSSETSPSKYLFLPALPLLKLSINLSLDYGQSADHATVTFPATPVVLRNLAGQFLQSHLDLPLTYSNRVSSFPSFSLYTLAI